MHFTLERNSGVPLGVQIAHQLRLAITSGRLKPGERLPSARDQAAELEVNFHTVRKVYSDLEQLGLLRQDRGLGTFVADRPPPADAEAVRSLIRRHVERMLAELAGLELTPEDIVRMVEEELNKALPSQQRSEV
jgi:GntR family transcriptional regulator